jgi:uncharacterized protein
MEKSAQIQTTRRTECFTMSETRMDNKPLSPSSEEPHSPATAGAVIPSESSNFLQPTPLSPANLPLTGSRGKSPLRAIFVGPDGIYAFPKWLIYLAMALFVFQIEGWLLTSIHTRPSALWWHLLVEASMAGAAILPAFVMVRIERQPFAIFGLPPRPAFGRNFWVGALWGLAALTALILVLRVTGSFYFGSLALHGTRIWKFAAYYALFFLLTGFFEEFLLRGYSQWVLTRGFNFWPTAIFLSLAFGLMHSKNPGEAKSGLVAAGLIGFFLCLTLRRTGNLWWGIGFHMAWDWGESFLYSVPDSGTLLPGHLLKSSLQGPVWLTGGSVGPEGSYLIFALIAALCFLFSRMYPEIRYDPARS